MTCQIPELEYYSVISVQLSNVMDAIGYSQEYRERTVKLADEAEVFNNISQSLNQCPMRRYNFGSRGEGSTGPGLESDKDCLYKFIGVHLVTDLTQCKLEMKNLLMVQDNFTHPGYVKLQVVNISSDSIVVPHYCQTRTDDKIFDSLNRRVIPNTIFHRFDSLVSGPALHTNATINVRASDNVLAFRCSKWPQEGYEFFQRRRLYGWPTATQIQNANKYGCFAAPVGHPFSSERHLEWRLSFSVAERELIRSFEDTAMKVYVLLKLIKKTYIEPLVGDAFSSYHCKVCMLWMRESTPRELWRKENILQCLMMCIKRLYEWATSGFCPDYFVIKNNIYDRRIFGEVQTDLVIKLRDLLSSGCPFLLGIQYCNFKQSLEYMMSFLWCTMDEIKVNYEFSINGAHECRLAILASIPQHYPTLFNYLEKIMYASKDLQHISPYPLKHVKMLLCLHLGFHITTYCKEKLCLLSREKLDDLVALASVYLSLGINSDATSVRLKLCGLGLELGNYDLIQSCLQDISDHRMRYLVSATMDFEDGQTVLMGNSESCAENFLGKTYSTEELLQTQVSFSVVYVSSEISITPKPLRMEMFRSVGAPADFREKEGRNLRFTWSVVDTRICLYFFQYLNFRSQGKEKHKLSALNNMIHVIRMEFEIHHRDTALNLLGYAFMQENQLTNAFDCFIRSLKIRPYHNAAKFYLAILFKRDFNNRRRHAHY